MKVLLLGANGQLGWELEQSCPEHIDIETCDFPKVDFLSVSSIDTCIRNTSPDWIINASAYTAVDQAEAEPDKANQINHLAVREIATLAKDLNICLVHISTDYVFNGQHHLPILPNTPPDPQSVYGKTKLDGETCVQNLLPKTSAIIRTAWLYSAHGANFVKTMIRLMQEKDALTVVNDQIGTPTWAAGLAAAIWKTIDQNITGIFHYTDAGQASWYDFALAIQEIAFELGLLKQKIPITPVPTSAYPTPAARPAYSVLNTDSFYQALEIQPVHWRTQLEKMLNAHKKTL